MACNLSIAPNGIQSLQLLEFLIKNGSERVIDDARSHLSLLKMLRQFQFYDQNGKDQGINVRNRAKELADLLSDVDKIRGERKKAKSNRNKFGGVEGGSSFGAGIGSSNRYGGFGSEDASYGGYTGGVYGDGGGFGGQESSTAAGGGRRDKFEEYDEGDDVQATTSSSRHTRNTSTNSMGKKRTEEPKQKAPEIDLFEFGDDIPAAAPPQSAGLRSNATDDDDFDDFISATPAPSSTAATSISNFIPPPQTTTTISSNTTFAAPQPVAASQASSLSGLANFTSISPAPSAQSSVSANTSTFSSLMPGQSSQFSQPMQPLQSQPPRPTGYQAAQPNYFTSVQAQPQATATSAAGRPGMSTSNSIGAVKPVGTKSTGGADAFSNLWSTASVSAGIAKKTAAQGPNLASLAKEKTAASIWGTASKPVQPQSNMGGFVPQRSQPPPANQSNQAAGGGLDDLLG